MRFARDVGWRLRPPQHVTQGRLAQRLAQRLVRPQAFHDRVVLRPSQLLDQFGLGAQGRGFAARLVARL